MIEKYIKFPKQLSYTKRSIYDQSLTTKSADEKFAVVHSTTQPDEYQLLEKRTQN